MTHHPGIKSTRELFDKAVRELAKLEDKVSPDNFANFVITAYSICDWVEKDPAVPALARSDLQAFRSTPAMAACRDLANGTKHFLLNYPNTVVVDATCTTGFGMGRYSKGPYGVGEPTIQVTLVDGTVADGLQLAREITDEWRKFLATHGV
jgi:hypothetical protein